MDQLEKLPTLPKDVTDEIREILEGCRDGRLEHEQRYSHCGTAHCVAGWKQVRDCLRDTGKEEHDEGELFDYGGMAWDYAQQQWGLSDPESAELFRMSAQLPDQFEVLRKLESGLRLRYSGNHGLEWY